MAVTVYQNIYDAIKKGIDTVLINGLEKIAAYISIPLTAAFVLYIIIYGIAIMRGQVQEPLNEGIKRLFKLAFIWYVAINPSIFVQFFSKVFLTYLPNEVTGALLGKVGAPSSAGTGGSLDAFVNWGYLTAERIIQQSGWLDVGTYILAGIIYVGTVIAGCAAFLIAAMALIILATLLVVGPIFVSFMLFETTNRWFWSWLSNLFSFAFLQILLVALLVVAVGVIEKLYDSLIARPVFATQKEALEYLRMGAPVLTASAFGILTVYVITIFLFRKLPELTSSISGGISVGLEGLGNSAKNSLTKPFTTPYKAMRGISRAANKLDNFFSGKGSNSSSSQSTSTKTSATSTSQTDSAQPIGQLGSTESSSWTASSGLSVSYSFVGLSGVSGLSSTMNSLKTTGAAKTNKYIEPVKSAEPSRSSGSPGLYGTSAPSGLSSSPSSLESSGSSQPSNSSREVASSSQSTQAAGSAGASSPPPSSESSGSSPQSNSTGEMPGPSRSSSSSGSSATPGSPGPSTKKRENDDEML